MNSQYLIECKHCKSLLRNIVAFIAGFCYFLLEITTTSFLKMSIAGRLKDGFGSAAFVGLVALMPIAACADDANQIAPATGDNAQITRVAANTGDAPTPTPVAMSTGAVVSTQEITRKEAFRASTNQIVYHVGEGIVGMPAEVLSLQDDGYKVSAFLGGKPGEVECWVAKGRCGKYNQDKIFDGTMSGIASLMYDDRLGSPKLKQIAALSR